VLSIAYNILAGGTCLEDLELLRNDEAYLDALGASRIPDPTTAGDFCRRFESAAQVDTLMHAINGVRIGVWKRHAANDLSFFERATIDADGTIAPTDAQCKQGIDISYDGRGLYPLVVSWPIPKNRCTCSIVRATGPATKTRRFTSTSRSRSAGMRGSKASSPAATPTSPRPPTWIAGTMRAT
jgi:hypothetical protein